MTKKTPCLSGIGLIELRWAELAFFCCRRPSAHDARRLDSPAVRQLKKGNRRAVLLPGSGDKGIHTACLTYSGRLNRNTSSTCPSFVETETGIPRRSGQPWRLSTHPPHPSPPLFVAMMVRAPQGTPPCPAPTGRDAILYNFMYIHTHASQQRLGLAISSAACGVLRLPARAAEGGCCICTPLSPRQEVG